MAIDWDKLRIFHNVAEAGSFTHAGEALGLSQSAVSRQISGLEDSLGVILFHRHARGLVMTEQGEMLHATTRDVFGRLALIEGQLVDTRDKAEGPLNITVSEFLGTHWLVPMMPAFHRAYPDIQLTMMLDDRVLNLGMREADVALRLFQPNQPDLVQRHLARVPLRLYAHESYLADRPAPARAEELRHHTLIVFPDSAVPPYPNPNWMLAAAGIDSRAPNLTFCNSVSAMLTLVQGGYGIAGLPRALAQKIPGLVEILGHDLHQEAELFFVYPEVRRHSRRIELFRDFLVQHISHGVI